MLINNPKLKSCFRVEIVQPDEVFLIGERESIIFKGKSYRLLTPLLRGYHTVDEILDILQGKISSTELYYALMVMNQKGCLIEGESVTIPEMLLSFCEVCNVNPQIAYQRLQSTVISIESLASLNLPITLPEFSSKLGRLHINVAEFEEDNPSCLTIIITDNYCDKRLQLINQKALKHSNDWLLINPFGLRPWIGPIFKPGKTACWECLKQRLMINRPIESYVQRHNSSRAQAPLASPLLSLPTTLNTALDFAAIEIFKWIVQGGNPSIEGTLLTYDVLSSEIQKHTLVKRPQCLACGNQAALTHPLQPPHLETRAKTFIADGGYRICSPQTTLNRYVHHISPITGIVRDIYKIPVSTTGLNHTYVSKHHVASMFDTLDNLNLNIVGRSAGKGKTEQQAKASAFCEAIERYSSSFHGDEIRHKSSYCRLGDLAIHPNQCMNFSELQYQQRQAWNQSCDGWFQKVPAPFDEEATVDWTPVWSMTHQTFKYLPTAYCYHGYPQSDLWMCWSDSNGCATGNTLEESILQGFMEVVERDCIAIWWYNRVQRPQVDLASFNDTYFDGIKDYYRSIHRELWVLDITNDLGVPAFAAISRRGDRPTEDIIFGFGAHFDATLAIGRALTEANQFLPNVLQTHPDGTTKYPQAYNPLAIQWWQTATLANQPYLRPANDLPIKRCIDYSHQWNDDLLEDIAACQKIVEKHGLEFLVLDQTRPDVGLNVTKTIIPGLRHLWKRLGPGRLYDVPVTLGWLPKPHQEHQLNPFPMWI